MNGKRSLNTHPLIHSYVFYGPYSLYQSPCWWWSLPSCCWKPTGRVDNSWTNTAISKLMKNSVSIMYSQNSVSEKFCFHHVKKEQEGILLNEDQGRLLWGSNIKTDPYIWERINPPRTAERCFQSEKSAELWSEERNSVWRRLACDGERCLTEAGRQLGAWPLTAF